MYEDEDISKEYADRFYIQLQFSSGMIDDAFATDRSNFLPVVAPYCLVFKLANIDFGCCLLRCSKSALSIFYYSAK